MVNVYGLPIGHTKWVHLFTWTGSADSGMDRAEREAKENGYRFAAYTAMTNEQSTNVKIFTETEIEELGGMDVLCK